MAVLESYILTIAAYCVAFVIAFYAIVTTYYEMRGESQKIKQDCDE
jgi:hypothetical protein